MASKVFLFFHLLLLCLPKISMALANLDIKTAQYALLALKSSVFDPLTGKKLDNQSPSMQMECGQMLLSPPKGGGPEYFLFRPAGQHSSRNREPVFSQFYDPTREQFERKFAQEMGYLRRLKNVSLSFNDFTGGIPSWLGLLPNLQFLFLANNNFTDPLPLSIFNASKLEWININFNRLEGSIPQEIGKLGNLKILDMQGNQFTGSVPLAILNMSSLQVIALTGNSLTGDLPENICSKLPNLQGVYLALNRLSGPLQSRFSDCSVLQILSLLENDFSGPIPRDFGNITG